MRRFLVAFTGLLAALVLAAPASALTQQQATNALSYDAWIRCHYQVLGSDCSYDYILPPWSWWGGFGWTTTATYVRASGGGHYCTEHINTWGSTEQAGWNTDSLSCN